MVNIKDTAPESEEQKFKQKCNELRKRIAEVEESNEISTLALSRTRYSIRRLRLEYSILLERLEFRLQKGNSSEDIGIDDPESRKSLVLNEALDSNSLYNGKYKPVKPEDSSLSNSSKKETRDPNLPKRPTNAYLMFCEKERENIRADIESKNQGKPIVDFPKILTEIWRGMDERERMPYWKLFLEDRERYQLEMQSYSNKKRNFEEMSDLNTIDNSIVLDEDILSAGLNDYGSMGTNGDVRMPFEGVVGRNAGAEDAVADEDKIENHSQNVDEREPELPRPEDDTTLVSPSADHIDRDQQRAVFKNLGPQVENSHDSKLNSIDPGTSILNESRGGHGLGAFANNQPVQGHTLEKHIGNA